MRKFFIEKNNFDGSKIIIDGSDVNHIKNVLRLEPGEQIEICVKENAESFTMCVSGVQISRTLSVRMPGLIRL